MSNPTVTVLASRIAADEKNLLDELERRGTAHRHVDPRRMHRLLPRDGTHRPGDTVDEVVLNREIGQVRALYAARTLEAGGAVVVNSAAATETCGDKWLSSLALDAAGVPTPRSGLALTPDAALELLEELGYPAVIKPLVGSWGRLVAPVPNPEVARSILDYVAALPSPRSHLVYLQEMVSKPERDIRVIVVGGEVLGATYRRGSELRTNVALGASVEPCPLSSRLVELATDAARSVGAEIAGVDLIEDRHDGLFALEVNHRVEFGGFRRAHRGGVPVAARVVGHLLTRLREPGPATATTTTIR